MTPNRFSTSKPQTEALYNIEGTDYPTLNTYGRVIMNTSTYYDTQAEFWVLSRPSPDTDPNAPYQINIFRVDCKDKRKVQLWVTT